jgi:hypothetical protein
LHEVIEVLFPRKLDKASRYPKVDYCFRPSISGVLGVQETTCYVEVQIEKRSVCRGRWVGTFLTLVGISY